MKKLFSILSIFIFFLPVQAQNGVISYFLDTYKENENLEVVTIGKQMIELICAMDTKGQGIEDALKQLESIQIISSGDSTLNKEYYETAHKLLTKKSQGFKELFSIKDPDENMLIMVKENKGIISELVLLSQGKNNRNFQIISLNGKIDLDKLAAITKKMNIEGLNKLDTISGNK